MGRRTARGLDPWRDTGLVVRGPAVADIESAFAEAWAAAGDPLPSDHPMPSDNAHAGSVPLRVVATVPYTAGTFRIDQLVAAMARETLWLTDAYFAGTTLYVQALRSAARDGVDVRLLVPGASDISILRPFSRAGYRPLLEAGVRVFEWNGSMLHAKTAVADGRWARVGSTNLNLASWMSNRELDVMIEDESIAVHMEEMFQDDLGNATEVVLDRTQPRPRPRGAERPSGRAGQRRPRGGGRGTNRQHRDGGDYESARARARRSPHHPDRGPVAWHFRPPRLRLSAWHQLPDWRHRGLVVPRIAVSRVHPPQAESIGRTGSGSCGIKDGKAEPIYDLPSCLARRIDAQ